MSTTTGQDAKSGARAGAAGAGRLLQLLLQVVLGMTVIVAIGVGALVARLASGPLDVSWLARRAMTQIDAPAGAATVSIGRATLRWDGWQRGAGRPIDVVLTSLDARNAAGASVAAVAQAEISLATADLWHGRIAFRSIDLTGLRVALRRGAHGEVSLDPGPGLSGIADRPEAEGFSNADAGAGRVAWNRLEHVQVHDAALTVDDRQTMLAWSLPSVDIDLAGTEATGATGTVAATLAAGGETVGVTARLALLPQAGGLSATLAADPFNPARLATLAPVLAPLAAMDAPVRLSGVIDLDNHFTVHRASLKAEVAAGTLHIGVGTMPIHSASVSASGNLTHLDFHLSPLVLKLRDDATPTNVTAGIVADRANGKVTAKIVVDIDQVAFADLPVLWPAGTGGPGTRPWITKNITAGIAHDGHAELVVTAPEDFSDATLTSINGGMIGSDVTGHWLRPVPPIEHGEARVVFTDPDVMDISISTGRQAGGQLMLRPSKVHLTGLAGHDQFIAIQADVFGPFADLLTLLRHPKVKMLDRRPLPLNNPSGAITGLLTADFPLKNDLDMDSVAIRAVGKLTSGRLGGIAMGRDIDHANLSYDVNNEGLKIAGPADVAGIASQLKIAMDFRSGPPSEVLQRVSISASVEPGQITALKLDVGGVLTGAVPVQIDYFERRDKTGDVTVKADLGHAAIDAARLGWHKTADTAGMVDAHVLLKDGKLVGVEHVRAEAPDLSVLISADVAGGQPNVVRIQRLVVGKTTNVTGSLQLPVQEGQPYAVTLAGPSLDLSAFLNRHAASSPPDPSAAKGPVFTVDAKLDRVLMAQEYGFTNVTVRIENNGTITTSARLAATAGTGPVVISLTPGTGGRHLSAEAQDAGAMLRAVDVMRTMSGGRLVVSGSYDDADPAHPLSGTAEMTNFRIRNAPAIGRLLQAMSLYGLVEIAQGPGLGFTRMAVPFKLRNEILSLNDSLAYSASLGLTVKGTVDLSRRTLDLDGTVVPAYFFNSLLGRVPLIGRLFSPEKGGGVFAAAYSVRGPIDDPSVNVNPLSALTPGFLRGFFDLFNSPSPASPSRPPTIAEQQR